MNKTQNLDLLSENSLVVLSKLPSWPIRWGIVIASFILTFVLIMSAIIPFPETVEGIVRVQNSSELSNIYPNTESYLHKILVKEGDSVGLDQALAEMQVNVNKRNIQTLRSCLHSLDSVGIDTVLVIERMESLDSMAELQDDLQLLITKLKVRNQLMAADSELLRQDYFANKHDQLKRLIMLSREELALKKQEKNIAWDRFQTDKSLFLDSVIALKTYRLSTEAFLRISTNYIALRKNLENQELQLLEFERSQTEQLQSSEQGLLELDLLIDELKVSLYKQLQEIEKSRFLVANKSGWIHLHSAAKSGMLISRSEPLFAIEERAGEVIGIVKVKSDKIGKLKIGQSALIDLDAYSKTDSKRLEAEIIEIGELLNEDEYQVKLKIHTSNAPALGYKAEMNGKVTVVCESKTLLERLFKMRKL